MENQNQHIWDRMNAWIKSSLTLRLLTIGIIIMILLVPLGKVKSLIYEREGRKHEAESEISHLWGGPQTIQGPVLTIPYLESERVWREEKKEYEMVEVKKYAHFLPETLRIGGIIIPEVRYRGIFEVSVYQTDLKLEGHFEKPDFSVWQIEENQIRWDEAIVSFGLTDLRSIREKAEINWAGAKYSLDPGSTQGPLLQNSIETQVNDLETTDQLPFSIQLKLNGNKELNLAPFGKTTTVKLNSPWKDPSFVGAFSPDRKEITSDGFEAEWKVLHLNRSYPQQFQNIPSGMNQSLFGVRLFIPVDEYQKSMRSIKYAILLITLTFLIFFFVQWFQKIRIHPIQYLIVGFALCLFYTLLISLSEHISFHHSYIISSGSIIGLVTFYMYGIFRNAKITSISGGILGVIYTFIYVITREQDFALLMGSLGLLAILCIVMILTRKTNWYQSVMPGNTDGLKTQADS